MLNETLIVKDLLEGKNIDKTIMYRMCYLLSKWYLQRGFSDPTDIRNQIFSWGKKYELKITVNLNDCIKKAISDTRRLTEDNPVRVSNDDIYEITRRFDRKNVRLCALGLLCYAKQFADQNNTFDLPIVAFGRWVGISYNNIMSRYMWELEMFSYIKRESQKKYIHKHGYSTKSPIFKIFVPIENIGDYVVEDNNIRKLYDEIFS